MIFLKAKLSTRGYTLIETMAVVAIMGIMSVIAIANYGSSRKSVALNEAARQLIMDLRRAQNMAMSTVKFNGQIPVGGYGINISISSPGEYIVYADLADILNPLGNKVYDAAGEEKLYDRVLNSNIEISSTDANNINFVPPDPQVWIDGVDGSSSLLPSAITLRYTGTTLTKIIDVNTITGQITGN